MSKRIVEALQLGVLVQPLRPAVTRPSLWAALGLVVIICYAVGFIIPLIYFRFLSDIQRIEVTSSDKGEYCAPLNTLTTLSYTFTAYVGYLKVDAPANPAASQLVYMTLSPVGDNIDEQSLLIRSVLETNFDVMESKLKSQGLVPKCHIFFQTPLPAAPNLTETFSFYIGYNTPTNSSSPNVIQGFEYKVNASFDQAVRSDLLSCCTLAIDGGGPPPPPTAWRCGGTPSNEMWEAYYRATLPALRRAARSINQPFLCTTTEMRGVFEAVVLALSVVTSIDMFFVGGLRYLHTYFQERFSKNSAPSGSKSKAGIDGDDQPSTSAATSSERLAKPSPQDVELELK